MSFSLADIQDRHTIRFCVCCCQVNGTGSLSLLFYTCRCIHTVMIFKFADRPRGKHMQTLQDQNILSSLTFRAEQARRHFDFSYPIHVICLSRSHDQLIPFFLSRNPDLNPRFLVNRYWVQILQSIISTLERQIDVLTLLTVRNNASDVTKSSNFKRNSRDVLWRHEDFDRKR